MQEEDITFCNLRAIGSVLEKPNGKWKNALTNNRIIKDWNEATEDVMDNEYAVPFSWKH